jgi:hypothetical protein
MDPGNKTKNTIGSSSTTTELTRGNTAKYNASEDRTTRGEAPRAYCIGAEGPLFWHRSLDVDFLLEPLAREYQNQFYEEFAPNILFVRT